jgi:hypothetical protein
LPELSESLFSRFINFFFFALLNSAANRWIFSISVQALGSRFCHDSANRAYYPSSKIAIIRSDFTCLITTCSVALKTSGLIAVYIYYYGSYTCQIETTSFICASSASFSDYLPTDFWVSKYHPYAYLSTK